VKWNDKYREQWGIHFGFADLDEETEQRIARVCKRAYRTLHLRDYGRVDLRLRPDGKIFILEANPNPDLAYGEEVAEAAEKAGCSYEHLIAQIINQTLKRNL
jgi:D-alanine-D-alanine ligase